MIPLSRATVCSLFSHKLDNEGKACSNVRGWAPEKSWHISAPFQRLISFHHPIPIQQPVPYGM